MPVNFTNIHEFKNIHEFEKNVRGFQKMLNFLIIFMN